jgi:vitamin B12 transporter
LKTVLFLSAAFVAGFAASPAFAEGSSPEEIVVLASGFAQPASGTGQAITVLDRDRIDRTQAVTVADALRDVPGLSVIARGPLGAQTSVFVRGGNSAQTLVLIDGVRVNDPSSPNAAFDFGGLGTDNVERIEVLRGPNSIVWGSQAIGGVINIETVRPSTGLAVSAAAEGGAYNTRRGRANVSGASGALRYSVGGSLYRTDGFSALPGGTEADGSRQETANARLTFELAPDVEIDLRGDFNSTRTDFDSKATNYLTSQSSGGANSLAEAHNRQWLAYAGLNFALADGRLKNRIAYTRLDVRRLGTDPVVNTFNNYLVTGQSDRFEYRGAYELTQWAEAAAGLEHETIHASTAYEGAKADLARNEVTSGYLQLTLRPLAGLSLTGGVRHDDYQVYGAHTTLGGNAAYTPNGGNTVLRATYAEGFRAPSLSEGQPPYGNLSLKPETARNLDLGIEQSLVGRAITATATYFHRTSTNLIVYSSATFQSENVGRVDTDGGEFVLVLRPTERLRLDASYALVDAFNRSAPNAGKRLQLRPQHSASFSADWETPLAGVKIGGTIRMVGDSFDDAANTVRLDGYALASLRASLPVAQGVELYGRVENLTDATYQTVASYNTPGRAAYAGVRARF